MLRAVDACTKVATIAGADAPATEQAFGHILSTTLAELPSQTLIPRAHRSVTAAEMLDRMRVST